MSATFAFANRGKRGVSLDPDSKTGRDHLTALVGSSDIVIHNQSPDTATRIGLDAADVVVEISAFGRDGAYAGRPALDPIVQAMSGIAALTGEPDGGPRRAAAPVVDISAALTAAFGALAALRAREATGEAQRVTVSLFEVGLMLNGPSFAMRSVREAPLERLGNASHALIADQFAAADGLVWLAVWDRRQWLALCELLGLAEIGENPAYATNEGRLQDQEWLRGQLAEAIEDWPAARLRERLEAAGIPTALTLTLDEVMKDPHVIQTGALVSEGRHPGPTLSYPAGPIRIGGRRPRAGVQAPSLGEHNDEVLAELRR
jgi:crotonobetainyl-CoA:carnitine CoA-transferase CaiB-like acyl-CoA transferase